MVLQLDHIPSPHIPVNSANVQTRHFVQLMGGQPQRTLCLPMVQPVENRADSSRNRTHQLPGIRSGFLHRVPHSGCQRLHRAYKDRRRFLWRFPESGPKHPAG
jgi:hypothetical protein